jgi:Flp pilus assembly pilin Flp
MKKIKRFWKDENGAELLEIAVYAGLFIVIAAATLHQLGTDLAGFFTKISASITSYSVPSGS